MEKHLLKQLVQYEFKEPVALCTVMEWKGSVPRKDYPMMLVSQSGDIVGTIGGGTMEKDVIKRAIDALNNHEISLDSFDFTNNDLSKDGGLCGGTVKVSVEPYTKTIQSFFNELKYLNETRAWITTFDLTSNTISRNHIDIHSTHHDPIIQNFIEVKKSKSTQSKNAVQLFRFITPKPILHIFGGGHVGKAVGELAHYIELDITIHDDRKSFVTKNRFPNALDRSWDDVDTHMQSLVIESSDLALVATRGHHHDFELMKWLLKSDIPWIGLVSSQRKWKLLSKGLIEEGFVKKDLHRVYAPVGIDIHAQTVPEIAVSIMGGIISFLRQK
ncbi:MAG: XdhC family protein [Candidatus Marinimicrobia bacterium]|jgi:xanthine dehydrogenase accessory factor|nr:XdhC family protein [Candidatus Neomarinimicrobiota bacterium]MBT3937259.1 XdhC family protein [Candidatus Neomarinimicrobiota bacterium]MBT3960251.1 XdhC family protein [Candidatus Neomarinimicrobiota bacterium]MBT4382275.1 XdhC family protein [Candidatus Neomarinimicrobiota bacterium]MBT4635676.1 XdhC family protein [Candidatus Neomarinimicrobiota bacterium]